MKDIGIGIIAFNRFKKIKKLVNSIKKNKNFNKHNYYILLDKNLHKKDYSENNKIKKYLLSLKKPRNLNIIFNKKNIGHEKNVHIILKKIFKNHSKAIFFEDDIILSSNVLDYFVKLFDIMDNSKKFDFINMWSLLPGKQLNKNIPNFFITLRMNFWGMGLNKKTYNSFIFDQKKLYKSIKNKTKILNDSKLLGDDLYFRVKNFLNFPKKMIYNDLKFQINCLLRSKYTLSPKKSLIINDGFDGTGANCLYDNNNFFNSNYSKNLKFKNINLKYNNKNIERIIIKRFKLNAKEKFYYNDHYQFFLYNYRNLKKKIKIIFSSA